MHDRPGKPDASLSARLDSWKAIAEYLGRDVSTVRRWERQEGLPVHRHLHRKLGSVYAFRSEIDDWWRGRSQLAAPAAPASSNDQPQPAARGRNIRVPMTVAAAGLVLLGLSYVLKPAGSAPSPEPLDFVAVLPIVNAADGGADDVFVDGLTEGLISGLSAVRGLKVISRSSSFRYKGKEIVPTRVREELGGVEVLLTGHVRHEGDRLTVHVELVGTRDDRQLWSNTYTRDRAEASDVSLHEAIVTDVVRALTGRERGSREGRYARNAEVYELYLRGRYHWYKRTPEALDRAVEAFLHVIERDPSFAPAYAGLADSYTLMGYFWYQIPFEEARLKARAAAARAIALDDSLAEAHTSMASVLEFDGWDWAGAEREYRRAIDLAPNYVPAHHWLANNLSLRDRHDEAIALGRRAVALDPLAPILRVALAHAYLLAGRPDDAVGELEQAIDIEPASPNAHVFLGVAYERQGRYDAALAEMLKANDLLENWVWKAFLADLYTRMNRPADARRIVREFDATRPYASHVTAAALYAAIGDRERALSQLRRACDARDPDIGFLKSIPAFDQLRDDPQFTSLLRRTGLG